MKKIGIFYGSATGTTADVARRIARYMGVGDEDIHDVSKVGPSTLGEYAKLVLGSSTWGNGEVEDDWYSFLDGAQSLDLRGREIAIFGCGDETMADTFCNAIGIIYDRLKDTGAKFIGEYPADVYTFDHSAASHDGTMRGLALDEVNHPEYTEGRIRDWAEIVRTA